MAKNGIVSKKSREIDLFDFTSFFGQDFLKFSGPMCSWTMQCLPQRLKSTFLKKKIQIERPGL